MIPVIFDDELSRNFTPLCDFRSPAEFLYGTSSLYKKLEILFGNKPVILTEKAMAGLLKERGIRTTISEAILGVKKNTIFCFINSRVSLNKRFMDFIDSSDIGVVYYQENDSSPLLVKKEYKNPSDIIETFVYKDKGFPKLASTRLKEKFIDDKYLFQYTWEYILNNGIAIAFDYENIYKHSSQHKAYRGVHLVHEENIFIDEHANIEPGVVILAESGPVIIERNTRVMANSVLYGPLFIGRESIIKAGSIIYGETSIGEVCRIGGEIAESIVQGYSNKQHHGFLGHAFLGEWVNLGAGTTNSDLKNNYSDVRVWVNGNFINSNQRFIGLTIGDHSKTAINTVFNTGTVVGSFVNVFIRNDFPPKYICSFTWGNTRYNIEKAIDTARIVMLRRDVKMSHVYENRIRYLESIINI